MRIALLLLSTIFLLYNGGALALAQDSVIKTQNISYEKVNPGSFSYSIKRLKEKTLLLLLSPLPSKKTKIHEDILKARLSELKKVVDEKNIAHIEKSSQRYSAAAGEYADYVLAKNKSKKDEVKKRLEEHKKYIEEFLLHFDGTTAEWRFIKHDLDYLDLNLQKMNE